VPARLETHLSDIWVAIVVVGAATILLKATGPVLLGGRELPPRVNALVVLLAPAVLAALVVTQVVGGDRELVFDARLVGLGAAGIALFLRAPLALVVVIAAAATAGLRALTG
jgi:branched-subunit amino acid transport protein